MINEYWKLSEEKRKEKINSVLLELLSLLYVLVLIVVCLMSLFKH